jgi:hypothetical protein
MSVLDWFRAQMKTPASHYLSEPIDPVRVKLKTGVADSTPLESGKHYFRLWLVEMFLANDRQWFADWHPAAHSSVNFEFAGKTTLVSNVVGASRLKNLDPNHLNRVIQQNIPLTALVPFNGGTVGLTAGLLAMKGGNDVQKFIKVLGDFGSLLAVPQLSAAMAVAKPLSDGIGDLLGATDGELLLGIESTLAAAGGGGDKILRAGYWAVVGAKTTEMDRNKFYVVEDRLQYGDTIESSTHLTGRNYMLFRIEARDTRDDWDSLATIQEPYERAIEMLKLNNVPEADTFLRTAIANALTCPELTKLVDRRRVVEQLKARYKEAKQDFGVQGAFAAYDKSLTALMDNAMSVKEASGKPEIRSAEVFKDIDSQ